MPDRQTVVYTAGRPQQAYLFRNLLAEQGISAVVLNDALQSAVGEVPFGWATAVRVVVREQDAVEARRLALDFDRSLVEKTASAEYPAGESDEPETLNDWPTCPDCKRRRTTTCPICETTSDSFASADPAGQPEQSENERPYRPMVLCSTCDEPFTPNYFRRCQWCGHDFGEGTQLKPPPEPQVDLEVGTPAIVIMIGIVVFLIAVVAYFAHLLP